jgi:hypothetical protein
MEIRFLTLTFLRHRSNPINQGDDTSGRGRVDRKTRRPMVACSLIGQHSPNSYPLLSDSLTQTRGTEVGNTRSCLPACLPQGPD